MLHLLREIIIVSSDNHTKPYVGLIFHGEIQSVVMLQRIAHAVAAVL
jgi:hypothetical protein